MPIPVDCPLQPVYQHWGPIVTRKDSIWLKEALNVSAERQVGVRVERIDNVSAERQVGVGVHRGEDSTTDRTADRTAVDYVKNIN